MTAVLMFPMAADPYMVMSGRERPVTRVVYVSPVGPDPFAFDPYVAGGGLDRMDINGFYGPDAYIEALGVGLVKGREGQSKG